MTTVKLDSATEPLLGPDRTARCIDIRDRASAAPALLPWLADEQALIRTLIDRHGALLLRGFGPPEPERLADVLTTLGGTLVDYVYKSTPRTRVEGRVFTATEYPADQRIPQHCEMAYARSWPRLLAFACITPAADGGQTPLADIARVTERLPVDLLDRFEARGVLYIRNYGLGVDLHWADVFQTDDPRAVDALCARTGIDTEWLDDDHLRTRQVCQGTARHWRTGDRVLFNQAHLFHPSNLPAAVREALEAAFGEEDLPRNARYGDGSPIDEGDLAQVRAAFDAETRMFDWQAGDVLLVDNMRWSHGRAPFTGTRRVLVAMADALPA